MSKLVLVVKQGIEGEKCTGLGYFQDGELVGSAELHVVDIDPHTVQNTFSRIPVLVTRAEEKTEVVTEPVVD